MSQIPVALQLYSVRHDAANDLPGVLRQVAHMGYEGVEFAGYYGHSAEDIKTMLDDFGLKAAGTHAPMPSLLGDELQKTIEFNKIIANKYLIVPGMPKEMRQSRQAWLQTAELFNKLAHELKDHDMLVGYHNHTIEFVEMDGELPWDTFFGHTKKEVIMQFDTGNAMHGGASLLDYLRRYPGRSLTVHLKEFSATNEKALIGEGDIPWVDVFEACETIGATEWYIVEQESYPFSPMESVRKCRENLKAMGV